MHVEWTDEQIERVKTLWAGPLSARQIGKEMGRARNAIIGKARRLGLPPRIREPAMNPPPAEPRRHRKRVLTPPGEIFKPVPIVATLDPTEFLHVALFDLEPHHCRWPCTHEDTGKPTTYCGHPKDGVTSYCGPHARISYPPMARRASTWIPHK